MSACSRCGYVPCRCGWVGDQDNSVVRRNVETECERCGASVTVDTFSPHPYLCSGCSKPSPENLLPVVCGDCGDTFMGDPGERSTCPDCDPDRFTKHDGGKPDLALWPPRAFESVGRVLTYGIKKYAPGNWRKVNELRRYYSAALRHLFARLRGERLDSESGLPHLAHAVCCLAFLLELEEEELEPTPERTRAMW